MRIAFVHNSKAFLPEVAAYTRYFSKLGFECVVVNPEELLKAKPDVAWHFMGMDRQAQRGVFTIHEYTSASVPPFIDLKNKLKKILNVQPDHRLFLNEYVRDSFGFNDGVPYGFRDMGVYEEWLHDAPAVKEYDLIYVGKVRQGLDDLLEKLKERSVLVVSDKTHDEVQQLIRKSRFGINFMPDIEPFNQQTSTKFLEYCACKVPVITSDYEWVRQFQKKHGGKYFYLKDGFTWDEITNFQYEFPDLSEWTWEKQIERSGILQVLQKL